MNCLASLPDGSPAGVETMMPCRIKDRRGQIDIFDSVNVNIPNIKRLYYLHGMQAPRGGHAHRATRQILYCVTGSVEVLLSDGRVKQTYTLCNTSPALVFGPLIWIEFESLEDEAVISVMCDTIYDPNNTIRDWERFRIETNGETK